MYIVEEFSQTIKHSMSVVSYISSQSKKENVGRIIYLFTKKRMLITTAAHCITKKNGVKEEERKERSIVYYLFILSSNINVL
jgi:hypothetical protein